MSCSLISCSLKYDEEVNADNISPELEFENVRYKKYEENSISSEIQAEFIEQYKGDGSAYARNAEFKAWNKDTELTAEGSCTIMSLNSDTETYILLNDININNLEQNFRIKAENLKWNGKSEQLTSSESDTVYLSRDDIEIEGQGFFASGVSKSFRFSKPVSGIITTEDSAGTENNEESREENHDE